MALQIAERAIVQGALMSRAQDDVRRLARVERLLPARRAKAPAVAGDEAGKAVIRHRRREIVALSLRISEELGRGDDANRVAADIVGAGVTAAIAIEAGHRPERAILERFAQHVERR